MADVQYASNAKANAALTTGIIGTSLGALASVGGLAGLLGVNTNNQRSADPEDRPVSRYEMGLIQENTLLKANQYVDNKMLPQAVWNATQEGILRSQAEQLQQLYSLTKLVVPNDSVMPGWGGVTIKPAG